MRNALIAAAAVLSVCTVGLAGGKGVNLKSASQADSVSGTGRDLGSMNRGAENATGVASPNSLISVVDGLTGVDRSGYIRRQLDSAGAKYTIDKDGDFVLPFSLSGGRKQRVFINARATGNDGLAMLSVWSPAFCFEQVSTHNMQVLLELSSKYPYGAWQLNREDMGNVAVLCVQLPESASGQMLMEFASWVATTADEVEKFATHADAY